MYNLSKRLATLNGSLCFFKSTKNFLKKLKSKTIPDDYQLVSFDVKSLINNVPLDRKIK